MYSVPKMTSLVPTSFRVDSSFRLRNWGVR